MGWAINCTNTLQSSETCVEHVQLESYYIIIVIVIIILYYYYYDGGCPGTNDRRGWVM